MSMIVLAKASMNAAARCGLIALPYPRRIPTRSDTFSANGPAVSMVSARQGITACLPYAASLVQLHQLEMRPVYTPELRRKFLVYRRASAALSPAAATFMEFLFAFVSANGWCAGGT